jgi:UDP-N-acetylmuramyl pentapeptide phosphotransferase/UDP-N-acetylglucosamine-1-phosphate transferase
MTVALLWIATALTAALVSSRAARHLATSAPLRRTNYRGIELPTATGVAVVLGFLAGPALIAVLHVLFPSSERLGEAAGVAFVFTSAAMGFGLLGLWDDLAGRDAERGWRAHVGALRRGHATSGAVKLFGGTALALVIIAPQPVTFWWAVADSAVIALSANLFNLFDTRPGRACKAFVFAVAALMVVGGPGAPALAAAAGAAIAFLPFDLRERAMLGDTGSNALGAIVGVGIVLNSTHGIRIGALCVLVVLTIVGERPGLSRIIDRVPPLRKADRAGRVPE